MLVYNANTLNVSVQHMLPLYVLRAVAVVFCWLHGACYGAVKTIATHRVEQYCIAARVVVTQCEKLAAVGTSNKHTR
jgi:hypothetical protein